ncbi:MAG: hypothetical protein ABIJ34_05220 [archaeon]
MKQKLMIWVFAMILLTSGALSIGVTPSKKELFYEPNIIREESFMILNNEHRDLAVTLIARGELADYVTFEQDTLKISAEEGEKIIKYRINIPKLRPGEHSLDIIAVESSEPSDSILVASIGVTHKLSVMVPYPDQYIEGILFVSDAKPGGQVAFTLSLSNVGEKDITSITGKMVITGPDGEGIATVQTNRISLASHSRSKIAAEWTANANPGTYHVMALTEYDNGKIFILEKDFDLGEPLVELEGVRVDSFKLGTIAKLDITVANKWNQPMPDVFAVTDITTTSGTLIDTYKTSSQNIPSSGKSELNAYWDTKDANPDDYLISVKANYLGRVNEKIYEMKVKENSIEIKDPLMTGQVLNAKSGFKLENPIALFIVGCIAILVLLKMIFNFVLKLRSEPDGKEHMREKNIVLHEFLKTKLKEGYSKQVLRESLMKKGWSQKIIDEEMLDAEDEVNLGR